MSDSSEFVTNNLKISGHASQASVYVVAVCFTILSCLVVLARLLTRIMIVRQPGLDDAFIAAACVAQFGMGAHMWSLALEDLTLMSKWWWAFVWLYYAALYFTKMSILLQYLRIFPQEKFRKACFVVMGVVSAYSLWAVFSGIFACNPVSSFWDMSIFAWDQPGCLPRLTVWYSNAAINIITDCAIALLPLPIINSLQISRRQKTILTGVFAAGLFTCFISILRLVYIFPLTSTPDVTWNSPLAAIWSCVETNIGIWCSCVPTLKGCVQRYYPKLLDSFHSASAESAGSTPPSARQDSVQKGEIKLQSKISSREVASHDSVWSPAVISGNGRKDSRFSDSSSEHTLVANNEAVPASSLGEAKSQYLGV